MSDEDDAARTVARARRLAHRAMRPERPSMLECLQRVTCAPDAVCRRFAGREERDPLRAIATSHYARLGLPWAGLTDPREAWESVAPVEWVGDAARGFAPAGDAIGEPADAPPTLRAVVTLASDPRGVAAAEELAREVVHRVRAWGFELAPARVVWRCVEPKAFRAALAAGAFVDVRAQLELASASREAAAARGALASRATLGAALARLGGFAHDLAFVAACDARARDLGERNPFAPLVSLHESGYALDDLRGDAIVLAAPLA